MPGHISHSCPIIAVSRDRLIERLPELLLAEAQLRARTRKNAHLASRAVTPIRGPRTAPPGGMGG
jgi:hypothetical protein